MPIQEKFYRSLGVEGVKICFPSEKGEIVFFLYFTRERNHFACQKPLFVENFRKKVVSLPAQRKSVNISVGFLPRINGFADDNGNNWYKRT